MSSQRPGFPERLRRLDGPRHRRDPERRSPRRGRRHRGRRSRPRRVRRGGDRRDRDDRHAGVRGHAPAHVADAGARRPAVLHARPLLRGDARSASAATTAPRTCTSATTPARSRRCNGGVTTLLDWSHINNTPDHSDAAIQGLKDAGIRAVYAHGMPTGGEWWMLSELNHPEDIRRIRETYFSSDDGLITLALAARQPGQLELRGREARLGARARPRHPDQRARRHAPPQPARTPREGHARPRPDGPDTTYIHMHRLDRRGARPDRRDRRQRPRSRRTSRC